MSILIFGNGPMLNEPNYSVMAPGSRTWQIVRTVAQGLVEAGSVSKNIIVLGLDETPRQNAQDASINCEIQSKGQPVTVEYLPLPYEQFKAIGMESSAFAPPNVQAVVATGSVQAYSTAAGFSRNRKLPLWIDIFGDPICETQSQLELLAGQDQAAADNKLVHVWKLLLDGLLQGDQFYGLSLRQRHAIQVGS